MNIFNLLVENYISNLITIENKIYRRWEALIWSRTMKKNSMNLFKTYNLQQLIDILRRHTLDLERKAN